MALTMYWTVWEAGRPSLSQRSISEVKELEGNWTYQAGDPIKALSSSGPRVVLGHRVRGVWLESRRRKRHQAKDSAAKHVGTALFGL